MFPIRHYWIITKKNWQKSYNVKAMQRKDMSSKSSYCYSRCILLKVSSGLTEAIEKACTAAKKAWGEKNAVTGVAQMMDAVVGADPNFRGAEEEVRAGELSLRLDGSSDF